MENGRLRSSKTGMSWLGFYHYCSVHLMLPWLFFWNSLSNIRTFLCLATGSVRLSDVELSEFYCIWIIQLLLCFTNYNKCFELNSTQNSMFKAGECHL
jgi:hypothetical protein